MFDRMTSQAGRKTISTGLYLYAPEALHEDECLYLRRNRPGFTIYGIHDDVSRYYLPTISSYIDRRLADK